MNTNSIKTPEGLEVLGQQIPRMEKILTNGCLELIADLERNFGEKRRNLLIAREDKQKEYNKGVLPDFPSETQSIRD
ncbi:MAG: malate synthase A, partial [Pseudomonadota bacterium]|nr:malate synthase A [Pseudomonadota bacterium]